MRTPLPACKYNLEILEKPYAMRADQFNTNYPGYLNVGNYTIQGTANSIPFIVEARMFSYYLYTQYPGEPFAIQFSETYLSSEMRDRRWDSDEVIKYYACKLLDQLKDYLKEDLNLNIISENFNENDVC